MKTALSLCLATLALGPAQAQIFRPEAVDGAVIGGLIGGVIGHQSGGNNGWQGAALGAAAGLLVGQAVGEARHDRSDGRHHGTSIHRSSPRLDVRIGYGHGSGYYYGGYGVHRGPVYRGHPGWSGHRPSYVYRAAPVRAVWSAPVYRYPSVYRSGYPDYGYSYDGYAPVVAAAPVTVVAAPAVPTSPAPAPAAAPAAPQQITIVNHYYQAASPMAPANALFGR